MKIFSPERLVVVLVFLAALVCFTGCRKPTDEEAIRETLDDFNKAYASKDIDRLFEFFSKNYVTRMEAEHPGGFEKSKGVLQQTVFAPYKTIGVTSDITSIERVAAGYLVNELVTMKGTDAESQVHVIVQNQRRAITFVKYDDKWEIEQLAGIHLPGVYDSLTPNYPEAGRPGLIYITHISMSFVSVIDPTTNTLIGKIPCGNGSDDIAFAYKANTGYIASANANTVTVFDRTSNAIILEIPVGYFPMALLATPDERYILVSHQSGDGIWVLEEKSRRVVAKLPGLIGSLYLLPGDQMIYQPQIITPYVAVIDPAKNFSVAAKIEVGGRPLALAFTPDGHYAYVTNFDLNEVEKIDTRTRLVVKRIGGIKNPRGIAIAPDGKYAYVTNVLTGTVTIINLVKDTPGDTLDVGTMPTTVTASPGNASAYVCAQAGSVVSVIDLKTRVVVRSIDVADNPINIIVDGGPPAAVSSGRR
jgi:YVTN family beta-propeller protein